jgi:hypothetical protein
MSHPLATLIVGSRVLGYNTRKCGWIVMRQHLDHKVTGTIGTLRRGSHNEIRPTYSVLLSCHAL